MHKSKATTAERFAAKIDKAPGHGPNGDCWLWTGSKKNKVSYGFFSVPGQGNRMAHRVAYEKAHGPIPGGLCVLHSCDVPSCVNPGHLSVGTQADNIDDCRRKGRFVDPLASSGERSAHAKLKNEQVLEMRRAWAAGEETAAQLSRRFHVDPETVSDLLKRRTWKHI